MCPTLNLLLLAEEMVEMTNPAWLLCWQSSIVGEDAIDCFLWFLARTARYVCSPTLQTYPRTLILLVAYDPFKIAFFKTPNFGSSNDITRSTHGL